MIDKSQFSVNEKPNEYLARFRIEGEVTLMIIASSLEEAKAKARKELDDDNFGMELDSVDSANIAHVGKSPPMYRVMRDGHAYQVSHLQEGDTPREPDERGF